MSKEDLTNGIKGFCRICKFQNTGQQKSQVEITTDNALK